MPVTVDDFLSKAELSALNEWVLSENNSIYFQCSGMGSKRKTTRYSKNVSFPKEALLAKKRISEKTGLTKSIDHYCEGIIASFAPPDDSGVYLHKDKNSLNDVVSVHCNIVTSHQEKGGTLFFGKEEIATKENQLMCYPVSEVEHGVSSISGNKHRILWIFGFYANKENLKDWL